MKLAGLLLLLLLAVVTAVDGGAAQPALGDLSFMAGLWQGESAGGSTEEAWLPPRGGMMLGLGRTIKAGRVEFEYLRIEEREGKLAYVASPQGQGATPFPLLSLTGTRVVFENLQHDFPKRIIYERKGDELTGSIEGDGGKRMSWTWKLARKLD
jgi:hypothetical protein